MITIITIIVIIIIYHHHHQHDHHHHHHHHLPSSSAAWSPSYMSPHFFYFFFYCSLPWKPRLPSNLGFHCSLTSMLFLVCFKDPSLPGGLVGEEGVRAVFQLTSFLPENGKLCDFPEILWRHSEEIPEGFRVWSGKSKTNSRGKPMSFRNSACFG